MKGCSNCEKCGKEFKWYRNKEQGKAKYCSKICKDADHEKWCHKTEKINKWICLECGKLFRRYRCVGDPDSKFCSMSCFEKQGKTWLSKRKFENLSKEKQMERLKKNYEKSVIRNDGCWGWKNEIHHTGYTQMKCGKFQTSGHRISWELHRGPIPVGALVLHKCDNRQCTNPDHLFIGNHLENMSDMTNKSRRGSGNAKLKIEDVKEIKKLLSIGVPCAKIAKDYGVSDGSIWFIKTGKTWKHVEVE